MADKVTGYGGMRANPEPLIRKLGVAHTLTDEDVAVLRRLCTMTRRVDAGRDIIGQGDRPDDVHLVLNGFAHRYKILAEGKRQIVALLVPGDFCDLHVAILGQMDHSIAALTVCTVVDIPRAVILEPTDCHPRIASALWWATLVDEGTLREWLANLGRRDAAKGMAHLFCELRLRLLTVGLATLETFEMPLRHGDLADLLGLTTVHVSRTLQNLRSEDLIMLKQRRLTILNVERLEAFCEFDPSYLHLGMPQNGEIGRTARYSISEIYRKIIKYSAPFSVHLVACVTTCFITCISRRTGTFELSLPPIRRRRSYEMPKFYFHIHDGRDLLDTDGTDLANESAARVEAIRVVGEVLRDEADRIAEGCIWSLVVSDAHGSAVYQVDLCTVNRLATITSP